MANKPRGTPRFPGITPLRAKIGFCFPPLVPIVGVMT